MTTASPKLHDYFQAVEKRTCFPAPDEHILDIGLSGKRLRMAFQTAEQLAAIAPSFVGLTCEAGVGEPDARFFYWIDGLAPYLPSGIEKDQIGVWTSNDGTGNLTLMKGVGLMGADYACDRYYVCLEESEHDSFEAYAHAMIVSLFRWALNNGMLLLHAAAVGAGGKGVLLGGRGGKGKSTLASACLRRGMDFVSDDYTLLRKTDALVADPLYRFIGLNPDMSERFGFDLPVVRVVEQRGNKLLLDASTCDFAEALPIKAIVFPQFDLEKALEPGFETRILPIQPGPVITQIVHSSLSQFNVLHETDVVRLMLSYLAGLPAYRIVLGEDPMDNAAVLEAFIRDLA
ncbi:MAG: hypothetical protein IJH87_02440 [Atopobiaceae bacterium]|nr:hypothetical protein [Atopobiaceae bacterium]